MTGLAAVITASPARPTSSSVLSEPTATAEMAAMTLRATTTVATLRTATLGREVQKANSVIPPLIAVITIRPQSLSPARAVTSRDDRTRMRRSP
jgi:hypothetical protein